MWIDERFRVLIKSVSNAQKTVMIALTEFPKSSSGVFTTKTLVPKKRLLQTTISYIRSVEKIDAGS